MQTERTMCLKIVTNKKGSYIAESAISLPIFIIAVIVMYSIIIMYSCIENANFIAATELRRGAAEAIVTDTSSLIPVRISQKINDSSHYVSSVIPIEYGYRDNMHGLDELIYVRFRMHMKTDNPLNIASVADYDLAMVTRAYVGKIRNTGNMSADEMMSDDTEAVYVFPSRGEKYHDENCNVLRAASKATVLTENLKREYSPCPVCHSKNAGLGSRVYYFPNDGEDYHLPGCATLQRNYIEMEKSTAIERGYGPCSKCGG